jgi:hypothetical protein
MKKLPLITLLLFGCNPANTPGNRHTEPQPLKTIHHPTFTIIDRLRIFTYILEEEKYYTLQKRPGTGKLIVTLSSPYEQTIAGKSEQEKKNWTDNYSNMIGDFVFEYKQTALEAIEYCFYDQTGKCERKEVRRLTAFKAGHPGAATKMNTVIKVMRDTAQYHIDSSKHNITLKVNSYFFSGTGGFETHIPDMCDRIALLVYAFIFISDNVLNTLDIEYTNTDDRYQKQYYRKHYTVTDELFKNILAITTPKEEQ